MIVFPIRKLRVIKIFYLQFFYNNRYKFKTLESIKKSLLKYIYYLKGKITDGEKKIRHGVKSHEKL